MTEGDTIRIIVGQGVDLKRLDEAIRLANHLGLSIDRTDAPDCHSDEYHQKTVHKLKTGNIMVSPPVQSNETHFKSCLQVHDDCADLSDHSTGQHIQGMIFVEAARQLMLSVTENFILDSPFRLASYFVLNQIRTAFLSFAFPIETSCDFDLISCERKPNGTVKASCLIQFVQMGSIVARVEIDYCAYPKIHLEQREHELAKVVVEKHFALHGSAIEIQELE